MRTQIKFNVNNFEYLDDVVYFLHKKHSHLLNIFENTSPIVSWVIMNLNHQLKRTYYEKKT